MVADALTQPLAPQAGHTARSQAAQPVIFMLVLASMLYQMTLCFVHTVAFSVNASVVMLVELLIYLGCVWCLRREVPHYLGAFVLLTAINLLLLSLVRGYLDPKPFRDLMIVILFFWLGWVYGSVRLVDRLIAVSLLLAVGVGAFEWLAIDTYVKFFHTFSYFANQSGIGADGSGAIFEGQALTLNGFRPDGIGRTILPWLFGSHRISSMFLEPISLGNYATLVLAWSLAHWRPGAHRYVWFMAGSALLIAYADSRFGLVVSGLMLLTRLLVPRCLLPAFALAPWLMATLVLIYAVYFFHGTYSDSFVGRLTHTGLVLDRLSAADLLGAQSPLRNYGDMGYAYAVTRFGLLFCLLGWLWLWRLPLPGLPAQRFRALDCLYMTLNLSISGTSLFALKSAGLLWFMFGSLLASPTDVSSDHSHSDSKDSRP